MRKASRRAALGASSHVKRGKRHAGRRRLYRSSRRQTSRLQPQANQRRPLCQVKPPHPSRRASLLRPPLQNHRPFRAVHNVWGWISPERLRRCIRASKSYFACGTGNGGKAFGCGRSGTSGAFCEDCDSAVSAAGDPLSLMTITISTRRFSARPSAVSLEACG